MLSPTVKGCGFNGYIRFVMKQMMGIQSCTASNQWTEKIPVYEVYEFLIHYMLSIHSSNWNQILFILYILTCFFFYDGSFSVFFYAYASPFYGVSFFYQKA